MTTEKIDFPHALEIDDLVKILEVDIDKGLTDDEVKKRLESFGPNVIPKVKGSIWQVYLAPLFNWLINIYLIMTFILVFLTIWVPSIWGQIAFWISIIVLNIVIAIVQQVRAQMKLDALHKLAAPTARVIRNGIPTSIDASEIVPGDVIELNQGDRIPADARIIKSSNFYVDEASLTGESIPVLKVEDGRKTLEKDTPISEQRNMVFLGTYVQIGNATALVVNTGKNTEIGKISTKLEELNTGDIPIRKKINHLAKWLGLTMVIFLILTFSYKLYNVYNLGLIGDPKIVADSLVSSIITAMSIMPINIPFLATVVLLTGVLAMASKRVIIRNLSAVETLGRISILSSDKTGTITTSQMTVKRLWTNNQTYAVTGKGVSAGGVIFPIQENDSNKTALEDEHLPDDIIMTLPDAVKKILDCAIINNDAKLVIEEVFEVTGETRIKTIGNHTDGALLALGYKIGLDVEKIKENVEIVREYPFDSSVKRMSKIVKMSDELVLYTKGATEILLPRCNRIEKEGKIMELTSEEKDKILKKINFYAQQGYRVISFAWKPLKSLPPKKDLIEEREEVEQDLVYLGFACMLDPPRAGVKESIEECWSAGIKPIMITGDSIVTATTIAKQIGLMKEGMTAHEGWEIEDLDDEEFDRTAVFARVSPFHKQIIIERYQSKNKVVAMTGDGVNDALALSMADVGIAMGITGTDVAKQAADVIITDDSFNSTVTGIREGRGLFDRIRVMIFFFIAVNVAEAILYFTTSFIPNFALFDNWQRVYIFMFVHAFPPLALIFDRNPKDVMKVKPRDNENIFNKNMFQALLVYAFSLAAVGFLAYFLPYFNILPLNDINLSGYLPETFWSPEDMLKPHDLNHAKARTMLHTVIYIAEIFLVYIIRRMNMPAIDALRKENFWLVHVATWPMLVWHLSLMYIPSFQKALVDNYGLNFEVMMLSPMDWLFSIILGVIPLIALETFKYIVRKRNDFF